MQVSRGFLDSTGFYGLHNIYKKAWYLEIIMTSAQNENCYYVLTKPGQITGPFTKEEGTVWCAKYVKQFREYNVNCCVLAKIPPIYFKKKFRELIVPAIEHSNSHPLAMTYLISNDFEIIGPVGGLGLKAHIKSLNKDCDNFHTWMDFIITPKILDQCIEVLLEKPYDIECDDYL